MKLKHRDWSFKKNKLTEVDTAYCPEEDITVILTKVYLYGKLKSVKVTGFYYGEPNPEATEIFNGKLIVKFEDFNIEEN